MGKHGRLKKVQPATLGRELDALLAAAMDQGVIPGAVVAVSTLCGGPDSGFFIRCAGFTSRTRGRAAVTEETVYDLASLTKPLVTVVSVMHLMEKGILHLQTPLTALLPFSGIPVEKRDIRLWQLLSHCSGLPAHRPYFIEALTVLPPRRKEYVLHRVLAEPLLSEPGKKHVYSDLGFLLLGMAIEQLSGESLDGFYRKMVLQPCGLQEKLCFPGRSGRQQARLYAATEVCPWSRRWLHGVVHDDNCRVMGGVAGHAGLFGTGAGVLELCTLLNGVWNGCRTTGLFSREVLRQILGKIPGTTWTCGLDTPSVPSSSSGRFFAPRSVGHLGFTGTSFWLDLERGISVVLLSNRVHPSRKTEGIRQLRPRLHDAVMLHLLGGRGRG